MIKRNTNQTIKLSLKFKNKNIFIQNIKYQSKNQTNKFKKAIKLILNIVPVKHDNINWFTKINIKINIKISTQINIKISIIIPVNWIKNMDYSVEIIRNKKIHYFSIHMINTLHTMNNILTKNFMIIMKDLI